jgi:hypothetical protein
MTNLEQRRRIRKNTLQFFDEAENKPELVSGADLLKIQSF